MLAKLPPYSCTGRGSWAVVLFDSSLESRPRGSGFRTSSSRCSSGASELQELQTFPGPQGRSPWGRELTDSVLAGPCSARKQLDGAGLPDWRRAANGLGARLQLHVGGPCTAVPHVPVHSVALFGRHKGPWYILVPRQAQHLGHGPPLPGGESAVAGAVAGSGKWRPGREKLGLEGTQRIRPSMMLASLLAHSPGDPFSHTLHPPSQLASVPRGLDTTPLLRPRARPPLLEPLLPRAALHPGTMQWSCWSWAPSELLEQGAPALAHLSVHRSPVHGCLRAGLPHSSSTIHACWAVCVSPATPQCPIQDVCLPDALTGLRAVLERQVLTTQDARPPGPQPGGAESALAAQYLLVAGGAAAVLG